MEIKYLNNTKIFILKYYNIMIFVACFLSLMHKYYNCSKPNIVEIVKETKFSVRGVGPYYHLNTTVEDTYDQLIDIGNFSFKINPKTCKDYSAGLLLLIIVTSNPTRFENREVIRTTWGRSLESTKVLFLFGVTPKKDLMTRIQHESSKYGDIVQGNFIDAYKNMTYKHVMGLKWVTHHCPTAKYILKTDDDVVINTYQLRHFLAKELSPWGAKDLIACQVLTKMKPQRNKKLKWNVSKKEYPGEYYPTFCPGWAVLYSQDAVQKLLEVAQVTPYFWIDDLHITGTCAEKIGLPRTPLNNLILLQANVKNVKSLGSIHFQSYVFGPLQQNSKQMKETWNHIVESYY